MDEFVRLLPPEFVWGVATSAFQIEGSPLADGAGPSDWYEFTHQRARGHVVHDQDADVACDHYRRYRDDIGLMASLGVQAYRFSISWSRVLPLGRGRANPEGLAFYSRLVDTLREHAIQPMATLFHWDLPAELARQGGWANRDTVTAFREYAEIVFRELDDRVAYWCTINEPWVVTHMGYLLGTHPPASRDPALVPQVAAHLLQAHAEAVDVYRGIGRNTIGLVVNLAPCVPLQMNSADIAAAERYNAYLNQQFAHPALTGLAFDQWRDLCGAHWVEPYSSGSAPKMDFLGINYYSRMVVEHNEQMPLLQASPVTMHDQALTTMGWEVYPHGLRELLDQIQRDHGNIPIYVTENGAAYDDVMLADGTIDDRLRRDYIRQHLQVIGEAISAGHDIQGYFVWSLLDNFEWTLGYSQRFGLVRVDMESQQRTCKSSALQYRDWILQHRALRKPVT